MRIFSKNCYLVPSNNHNRLQAYKCYADFCAHLKSRFLAGRLRSSTGYYQSEFRWEACYCATKKSCGFRTREPCRCFAYLLLLRSCGPNLRRYHPIVKSELSQGLTCLRLRHLFSFLIIRLRNERDCWQILLTLVDTRQGQARSLILSLNFCQVHGGINRFFHRKCTKDQDL